MANEDAHEAAAQAAEREVNRQFGAMVDKMLAEKKRLLEIMNKDEAQRGAEFHWEDFDIQEFISKTAHEGMIQERDARIAKLERKVAKLKKQRAAARRIIQEWRNERAWRLGPTDADVDKLKAMRTEAALNHVMDFVPCPGGCEICK